MFKRIKEIFKNYKEIKYLAYHDSLTGLLNRNWLNKNMESIKTKYVYFIDINDLHNINKKGHSFGDEYIIKTVRSIKHDGTFVRYAGDEFLIFSNTPSLIHSNKLFTVGSSKVIYSVQDAIKIADERMIEAKIRRSNRTLNNSITFS